MTIYFSSGVASGHASVPFTLAIIATSFLGLASAQANTLIKVPAGDSLALIEAIETANQSAEATTIQLDGNSEYRFDLTSKSPPVITGHVLLIGDGARIVGDAPGAFGTLFDIRQTGALTILDLIIANFSTPQAEQSTSLIMNQGTLKIRDLRIEKIALGADYYYAALIYNSGTLDADRLRINDITVETIGYGITNGGTATIQNLLVSNFRLTGNSQEERFIAYVANGGCGAPLDLSFSTLLNQNGFSPNVLGVIQWRLRPLCGVGVRMAASMLVGVGCPFGDHAISGGLNFVSAENCSSDKASDTIGVFPNAAKLRTEADGGVAVTLPYYSLARDRISGSSIACPTRDAIRTPRPLKSTDYGRNECDIGAFETPPGTPLFEGGDNGLYYSPGHDGHYVTIEEVRPEEYVIFWNTFDLDGNHVWVYAMGTRDRSFIRADGYYQSEGVLVPGAGAEVNTDALLDWGRMTVSLFDCSEGRLTYDSELPQFGSGSFPLRRLGLIDALGCSDSEQ